MKLFFHPAAIEEGLDARRWYEQRSGAVRDRFAVAVKGALEQALRHPLTQPEISVGVRRVLLPKFPFQIIYRVRNDGTEVLAIAHLRRKPGYWLSRLGEQPPQGST